MPNKVTITGRIVHKHDIEANWLQAKNFRPLLGEIIVYDPDDTYDYPRYKIGIWDGNEATKTDAMLVSNLPFADHPITFDAVDPGIVAVGRDSKGHVVLGGEVVVSDNGGGVHSHTTTTSVAANTYVTAVEGKTTKLSISTTTDKAIKSIEPTSQNLAVTEIIPISTANPVTASVVKSSTSKSVAKVGTAVTYGTADVGTTETGLAKRAESPTTVGNANVGTGTNVASGTVKSVSAPAISVKVNSVAKDAYNAEYDSTNECLILSPVTITASAPTIELNTISIAEAVPSTDTIYGVTSDQISVTSATQSTKTLTPAADNGTIKHYEFNSVNVPVAGTKLTVATGGLTNAAAGASVMTGFGTITKIDALTGATIVAGNSGVSVVNEVGQTKNTATTLTGTTSNHTESPHNHNLVVNNSSSTPHV